MISDAYRLRVRSGLRGWAPPAWVNSSLNPVSPVDLDQQCGQLHPGQPGRRWPAASDLGFGGKLFGG